MRLALAMTLIAGALATPALAQEPEPPEAEARSAMGACLSAIIDGAPVGDVDGVAVQVRREKEPESCTVRVTAGQPVVVRDAVIQAITRRKEAFLPAKTKWAPNDFASRETFCNTRGERALNAVVSTAKPGEPLVLIATVFEAKTRDSRCDKDEGLQKPALPAG